MITQKQQRGFILAIKAGEIMMKSGGEIYRVEDVITHICRACSIHHVEVFITTTGIFASIGSGGEDGDIKTYLKAIPERSTDLQKISDVNALSRKFCSGQIDVEDALKELKQIETRKAYSLPLQLLGASIVSSTFCSIFGGSLRDSIAAIAVGFLTYLFSVMVGKLRAGYFINDFFCCALASFLALAAQALHLADNCDYIIIGTLMLFVPGAAITNALRDFLRGDMISGLSRSAEAFSIAIALVSGAGFMIKIWSYIGGVF